MSDKLVVRVVAASLVLAALMSLALLIGFLATLLLAWGHFA